MKKKNVIVIGVTGIAVLAIITIFLYKEHIDPVITQAQFIGQYNTEQNIQLAENVDEYMEKNNNLYCSHIQYGRDDKYVYTWMFCESYEYTNYGGIEILGGFSIPTRLDYNEETFEVNGYKQPGDGSLYGPTLRQIFPYEVYAYGQPSNEYIQKLESQTKHKFLTKIDDKVFIKLEILTNKYGEYKDWELQPSFAGKSFVYKVQNGSYYFAFITNGSGVGVVDAKCFEVNIDNSINEIIMSNINVDSRSVDPITCTGTDTL
jgi:hypothetical protein